MFSKIMMIALALGFAKETYASNGSDLTGLNSLAGASLPNDESFHAIVGLESSSFLYQSSSRGTSSTTFAATLMDEFNSSTVRTGGDLQVYSYLANKPSVSAESRELFVQTKKGTLGDAQVTLGRKLYEWSKLDHEWTMMSLYSPRFMWDELHPESIGMTGAFVTYETSNFEFAAFGSPIAIPERGTDAREVNGQIISSNPMTKPLPRTIYVMGVSTNLNYSLLTPPLNTILFRPNFVMKVKYKFGGGFWASANTGVLPVNQVQLAAEAYLDPSSGGDVQVNVRPQFPLRNISTAEIGLHEENLDLFASASYEQPFKFENQAVWINPVITPSSIFSVGGDVKINRTLSLNAGFLYIHEQPFHSNSTLSGVDVALPSRFPLKEGLKLGTEWKVSESTESNLMWVLDLPHGSHFITFNGEHNLRKLHLTVGAGADLLITDNTQGFVGQYYGDDRIRGWLKYAF
jgi:hypothetical protein